MANELVAWNDEFLVGNEKIDAQHKELVSMTNEFYAGCQMGGLMAKVFFMKTIQGALHYVKTHFSTEEDIMQKASYPDFHIHKQQHENFVDAVTRQVQVFEKEDNPDPAGFVKYLMNWVLHHIAESDKKYMPYIARLH
ncbi:MAG: bacteriohemerythrin [Treponema sp.]|jgi:hemerythrin-like metal-binding protein|nr:bacteriohemerythrin [Treponema sp.]